MAFGVFEASVGSEVEVGIAKQAATDKFAAAVYDVREHLGPTLFASASLEEFRDKVAMMKRDQSLYRIVEAAGVFPNAGTVRRIVGKGGVLEREFKQRLAVGDGRHDTRPVGEDVAPSHGEGRHRGEGRHEWEPGWPPHESPTPIKAPYQEEGRHQAWRLAQGDPTEIATPPIGAAPSGAAAEASPPPPTMQPVASRKTSSDWLADFHDWARNNGVKPAREHIPAWLEDFRGSHTGPSHRDIQLVEDRYPIGGYVTTGSADWQALSEGRYRDLTASFRREACGPYESFDACVRANSDKDSPESYCGEIKKRTEKESARAETPYGQDREDKFYKYPKSTKDWMPSPSVVPKEQHHDLWDVDQRNAARYAETYSGSGDVEDTSGPFAGPHGSFPVGTQKDKNDAKSVCNFPSVKNKNPGACSTVDKMSAAEHSEGPWLYDDEGKPYHAPRRRNVPPSRCQHGDCIRPYEHEGEHLTDAQVSVKSHHAAAGSTVDKMSGRRVATGYFNRADLERYIENTLGEYAHEHDIPSIAQELEDRYGLIGPMGMSHMSPEEMQELGDEGQEVGFVDPVENHMSRKRVSPEDYWETVERHGLPRQGSRSRYAAERPIVDTTSTFTPSDGKLKPKGDFEAYKNKVDQGGPEKVKKLFGSVEFGLYTDWCESTGRSPARLSSLDVYATNLSDAQYFRLAAAIQAKTAAKPRFEDMPIGYQEGHVEGAQDAARGRFDLVNHPRSSDHDFAEGYYVGYDNWAHSGPGEHRVPSRHRDSAVSSHEIGHATDWEHEHHPSAPKGQSKGKLKDVTAGHESLDEDGIERQRKERELAMSLWDEQSLKDHGHRVPRPGENAGLWNDHLPPRGPHAREGRRHQAAPDYLRKADDALTQLLQQKQQEFQESLAPLQQALVTVQQAEQIQQQQNPLNVLPPQGTVNVMPGGDQGQAGMPAAGAQDLGAAVQALTGGGGAEQAAGGGEQGGPPPAAAGQGGLPPELLQQTARRKRGGRPKGDAPTGGRRQATNVLDLWKRWIKSPTTTQRGGEPDYEAFAQQFGLGQQAITKLRNYHQQGIVGTRRQACWPGCHENAEHVRKYHKKKEGQRKQAAVDDKLMDLAHRYVTYEIDGPEFHNATRDYHPHDIAVVLGVPTAAVEQSRRKHLGSRKEAWSGFGPAVFPKTRQVPGWEWDSYLSGYTASKPQRFACECGEDFDTPTGYHRCKCGNAFNSYVIGTGGNNKEASAEKFIVRSVPVRKDVIVASKKPRTVTLIDPKTSKRYEMIDPMAEGEDDWPSDHHPDTPKIKSTPRRLASAGSEPEVDQIVCSG